MRFIPEIEIRKQSVTDTFMLQMDMQRKLSQVKQGKTVIIKSFENDDIFLKLMEMGCIPGERITVEKIAPFKDPISILVAGYRLSLRLDEAEHVIVEDI
jgi:ferrous iron transport protein A